MLTYQSGKWHKQYGQVACYLMCNILKQHEATQFNILTAPSDFFLQSHLGAKSRQISSLGTLVAQYIATVIVAMCGATQKPELKAWVGQPWRPVFQNELLATGCTWLLTACEAGATCCEVPSDFVLSTNLLEEHQIVGHTIQGTLKAYGGASKDGVPLSLQFQDLPW